MELVIFVGIQGSGKTSFYRERFAHTHLHVSKDNFPHNRNKARRQNQLLEEALSAGQSVVLDNTNAEVAARTAAIELAQRYGARVVGYLFETPLPDALERNRGRQGRARVPDVAIYATAKLLAPPTLAEGFDQLHAVRLTAQGGFEVAPLEGR